MTPEQRKKSLEKTDKGPVVIAAVRRGGLGTLGHAMAMEGLCLMSAAFLLTWLLLQTRGLSYARRVAFLAIVGLTSSVVVDLLNWNWLGFSGVYTLASMADFTITWLLAGLVIAKVAKPTKD